MSRQAGVTEEQLLSIGEYEAASCFSPLEKLVLRYADAMTETPVEIPDELFDELKRHFSPRQLVELTSAIAWENYRARFNHAFGLESEGFSEGAACVLPERRPAVSHASSR